MDASMMEMVDSVKQYGVLVPALVRPKPDGGYEMIAGHRRRMASELAEKQTLSCIVRDMTDDEATIVMVDSNLQREQILPLEKAFAYKMKLEAMKRQAGRPKKENLSPVRIDFRGKQTLDVMAEEVGDSRNQIHRYIRLTHLIPEILDLVDNSVLKEKEILQIALRPAVELSYLSEKEHQDLVEIMESEDCPPLPCPGNQNAAVFSGGQIGRQCAAVHHAGGKAQPGGAIQNAQGAYFKILLSGDAREENGGYHRESIGTVPQATAGYGTITGPPRGKSAHLSARGIPAFSPSPHLTPSKPAVPAEKER